MANLLVLAMLLCVSCTCVAAEVTGETGSVMVYIISQEGNFKQQGKVTQIPSSTKNGVIYYNLTKLCDLCGYGWEQGNSRAIYSSLVSAGVPCLVLHGHDADYEVRNDAICRWKGDSGYENSQNYNAAYYKDSDAIMVRADILELVYGCIVKDGILYCLRTEGRTLSGTRGLAQAQRSAVIKAMWLLFVEDHEDYRTIAQYQPTIVAATPSYIRELTQKSWTPNACVEWDRAVIYINTNSFSMATDRFAAMLLHEATHWVVGYNTLDIEGIPTEHQIRCLIRLGADEQVIQDTITGAMTNAAYQPGARRGQKLLDAEILRRKGEAAAAGFVLPINKGFYQSLGKLLTQVEEGQ